MSETVITWNFENILTIALMAAIGLALLRIVVTFASKYSGGG